MIDPELQQTRITKLADKWINPLGLGYWRIDTEYLNERLPASNSGAVRAFTVTALSEYLTATISVSIPVIAEMSDERLEAMFVHELMHIFLSEIQHECDDLDWHIERICTRLADAFLWAVDLVKETSPEETGGK